MLRRQCAETKEDQTVLSTWKNHSSAGKQDESNRRLPALGQLRSVRVSLPVTNKRKFEEISVNG